MSDASGQDAAKKPENFWDSYYAMAFLVISILFCRFYIFEPFKIPSGSMEPTLFGHEDYGDRIVTNKLAYATPGMIWTVLGVSAVLIVIGFLASHGGKSWRSRVMWALVTVGALGGIGLSWAKGAVAGEPQRFDVVVFQYSTEWNTPNEPNKKINYIKRLVGLPGDTMVVSGGDIFQRKGEKDEIIRKWEQVPNTQEILWYPISKAWALTAHEKPKADSPYFAEIQKQIDNLAFPWNGADEGMKGAQRETKSLRLDGSAPVTLTYKYPATNIYLKQGRWPFSHDNCPEANKKGLLHESGIEIRNPENKPKEITAYVSNTWEGVQCPNCKEIQFPLTTKSLPNAPYFSPLGKTNFFYGGHDVVNDLKLDLSLDVESVGALQIEVGSDANSALWTIGSSDALQTQAGSKNAHAVKKSTPALAAGKHSLSLSYLDATVIAVLDGQEIEKIPLQLSPPGRAAGLIHTVARVSFAGMKARVTRLDLLRDLYYTPSIGGLSPRQNTLRRIDDEGNYVARIPMDPPQYLMMGDNSPSSSDGRVWGFVPRSELVGRASFVWWPPSRWRFIK